MMTRLTSSLHARLLMASLAWITAALLLTGTVLAVLFRIHVERHMDTRLHDHLEEIAAAAEVAEDGSLALTWEPADPRFKPPLSGWYWEVRANDRVLRRSASLGPASLPIASPDSGPFRLLEAEWPAGEPLRIVAQSIRFPEKDEPLSILVAGPLREIHAEVLSFTRLLAFSLVLLAIALGAAAFLQVGYGLRPLTIVRESLNEIRRGHRARMYIADAPSELQPLLEEIDVLLAEREAKLERARAEAGDLAHALKTPIAIIANEATRIGGQSGEALETETRRMQRVVEHHLVRARAAAGYRTRACARIAPVLDDIRFTLAKLHPHIGVTIDAGDSMLFAGDGEDLGEMLGNLADNAAKWAVSRIVISATLVQGERGERLRLCVDDDGPGLDEAESAAAIVRGETLEGGVADLGGARGHGLGLSIVAHLAGLYGGGLELAGSASGGLRATLDLPAAQGEDLRA